MFFIPCEQIIYIAIYTNLHKWPIPIRFFNPCYEQSIYIAIYTDLHKCPIPLGFFNPCCEQGIYKVNEELKRDICHLHKKCMDLQSLQGIYKSDL